MARAALPHARRALGDPDPEVRVAALRAVGLFAPDARDEIGELARALSDPVPAVRVAAIEALSEFAGAATAAAPALAERLARAPTPEERALAAYALGNVRGQTEHVEVLLHALLGDVLTVQAGAASAIAQALEDEDVERRERVARALRALSATPPRRARGRARR